MNCNRFFSTVQRPQIYSVYINILTIQFGIIYASRPTNIIAICYHISYGISNIIPKTNYLVLFMTLLKYYSSCPWHASCIVGQSQAHLAHARSTSNLNFLTTYCLYNIYWYTYNPLIYISIRGLEEIGHYWTVVFEEKKIARIIKYYII